MPTLIASRTSPYARKVRVVLAEKSIEYTFLEPSPADRQSTVGQHNPLGKIPVLLTDDGMSVFDSPVIVEYIDAIGAEPQLVPQSLRERIEVKRWEALADGICDAASLIAIERRRDAQQQSAAWIARQQQKVERAIAELAKELGDHPWLTGERYTLADIASGCALVYVALRLPETLWREKYPNLAAYADRLDARPAFASTAPPPA